MKRIIRVCSILQVVLLGSIAVITLSACHTVGDPLPSWNQGAAKQKIMEFVAEVTTSGGPNFVPPPERIAVFVERFGVKLAEEPPAE